MSFDCFKYPYGARSRVRIECPGGRTEQHHKESCDVNQILNRYKRIHGRDLVKDFRGFTQGDFYDTTEVPDLMDALERYRRADEAFMSLPANIRKQFDHDPIQLLEFVKDPKNFDEAVKLGLMEPKAPVQPVESAKEKVEDSE